MKVTININTDHKSFEDDRDEMILELLHEFEIMYFRDRYVSGDLRDYNGDVVGSFEVIE